MRVAGDGAEEHLEVDRVVSTFATRLTCCLTLELPGEYRAPHDMGPSQRTA